MPKNKNATATAAFHEHVQSSHSIFSRGSYFLIENVIQKETQPWQIKLMCNTLYHIIFCPAPIGHENRVFAESSDAEEHPLQVGVAALQVGSPPYRSVSPPYRSVSPPYRSVSPPYRSVSPPYRSGLRPTGRCRRPTGRIAVAVTCRGHRRHMQCRY